MRNLTLPLVVLLIVVAVLAWQMSGGDPAQNSGDLLGLMAALPLGRQIAIAVAAAGALWLAGSLIWQAEQVARQGQAIAVLRTRLDGVRQVVAQAEGAQHDTDTALRVLADSDPETAIASLDQRLKDAERRATVQQSHNEAVDMQQRVEDIRNRQRSLRDILGSVIEKRRAIEPVFGEIKVRQEQLEQSLAEIETDAGGMSIAERLAGSSDAADKALARLKAGQERLAALEALRGALGGHAAALSPLQHPHSGIAARLDEVEALLRRLGSDLDALESGPAPLGERVQAQLTAKQESDRRVADLEGHVAAVQGLRDDLNGLLRLRASLEHLLAEAEFDESGRSIAERLNEFNAFAAQARTRLQDLESSMATLQGLKDQLLACQAQVALLQDPHTGVRFVLGETRFLRDRLIRILNDLELDGDKTLAVRLNELIGSKRETQARIAALADALAKMDTTRQEIGALFSSLAATLNTYLVPPLDSPPPDEQA